MCACAQHVNAACVRSRRPAASRGWPGSTRCGYLDGHIVLSLAIATRGRFPAIDVLASVSRLMDRVTDVKHRERARAVKELLAHYEENRDLVQVGAYRKGGDPLLDRALDRIKAIEALLYHGRETMPFAATLAKLDEIAGVPL